MLYSVFQSFISENIVLRDDLDLNLRKEMLNKLISKDPDNRYDNENMLQILFEIVDEYGTEDEKEKFINDNIEFTSFREIYNNLKEEIKSNGKMYVGGIYVKIILEENDLDELMEFVRNDPRDIDMFVKC